MTQIKDETVWSITAIEHLSSRADTAIYLFIIYYMVYTHVKSFTIVKNRVDKSRVTAGKHDCTEQI